MPHNLHIEFLEGLSSLSADLKETSRPAIQKYNGKRVKFQIGKNIFNEIDSICTLTHKGKITEISTRTDYAYN
jgi:hypothetical protein